MKRKLLTLLLVLATVFCLVMGLSACDNEDVGDIGNENPDESVDDDIGNENPDDNGDDDIGDYSIGLAYSLQDDNTYAVTGLGSFTGSDLVIPKRYEGIPVTNITDNAFSGCINLTSVTIPDSVTLIGQSAFNNCNGLEKVNITDLEAWCKILFVSSSSNPLSYASNLYINNQLLTELVIPNSISSIKNYAFFNCVELTGVTIPDSVTSIGSNAFYRCGGLTSVTMPDSVTYIGSAAFEYCEELTSITIPDSVTSIGNWAFYHCDELTSISIPDSVTSIGYFAFSNCRKLASVTIGNGVTSIGEYAFMSCSQLTDINYNGTMAQWNAIFKADGWDSNTGNYTVHCTDGDITKS